MRKIVKMRASKRVVPREVLRVVAGGPAIVDIGTQGTMDPYVSYEVVGGPAVGMSTGDGGM